MQTKGSPIHHCSREGGANYTTVKIMTFCCFVCPLRDYNAKDGGVEGKQKKLPRSFSVRGQLAQTHKTKQTHIRMHARTQTQLVSLLPVHRLCLQA